MSSSPNGNGSNRVVIGLAQMEISKDINKNLEQAERMAKRAAEKKVDILCYPELFSTEYFPQFEKVDVDYSEKIPGRTSEFLSRIAKENNLTVIGGSIYEHVDEKTKYNTCLVYGPTGNLLSKYRKAHIPHDVCFYERNYFREGDSSYDVINTPKAKIGVLICYDQWFPEPARILALKGAEILFYPSAIGYVDGIEQKEGDWHDAWVNVMRGHAISNSIPVVAVNRVGREHSMDFWGSSFVCDAFGKIIAKAEKREMLMTCEVDLSLTHFIREGWGFMKFRRPKTYKGISD
ncbi:MAG: acyltransferase [Candidatus Micrarchaeota archaeon]|nr:acyltransferase [Candidatus Micrarchaeota archaeon]